MDWDLARKNDGRAGVAAEASKAPAAKTHLVSLIVIDFPFFGKKALSVIAVTAFARRCSS